MKTFASLLIASCLLWSSWMPAQVMQVGVSNMAVPISSSAIVYVGSAVTANATSDTSFTVAASPATTIHDLLVISYVCFHGCTADNTVTPSGGGITWTARANAHAHADVSAVRQWYTCDAPGGALTVTFTDSYVAAGQARDGYLSEYSGNTTTSCLDQDTVTTNSAPGGGAGPTGLASNNATTGQAAEVLIGLCAGEGDTANTFTWTYTSGFGARKTGKQSSIVDDIVSSTGTYANTCTGTSNGHIYELYSGLASFKAQ